MSEHDPFMQAALDVARRGFAAGDPPIGAVIVRDGDVVAKAHSSVVSLLDATAHAEIVVIRESCETLRALQLTDCDMYVTVEPCPMCMAASHYAGIRHIYFGASLADMHSFTNSELMDCGMDSLAITRTGGILREQSMSLLQQWSDFQGAMRQ